MSDRLHDHLDYLAQQVTVVDLRDRALRTSRRRTRRNAVLVSAAVVAVVTGAAVLARATFDRRSDVVPVGPTPTASASPTPSPGPGPSTAATDFAFPPLEASATHLGPWTSTAAPSLPGRVFMFSHTEGGGPASISILADGQLRTSSLGTLTGLSCIANSYVFSPDGTRIAWVRGSIDTSRGQLVMTDFATRTSVVITDIANCDGGHGPKWSANLRSIIYQVFGGTTDDGYRQTSLDTGQTTALTGDEAAYKGVTTKSFQAYASDLNRITVEDATNKVIHTAYKDLGTNISGWTVLGLSEDGRYVTLGYASTDPGRPTHGRFVLDTVANKDVTPSVPAGHEIEHVILVPGNRMLVQITRPDGGPYARLLAADRTVIASVELERGVLIQHYQP